MDIFRRAGVLHARSETAKSPNEPLPQRHQVTRTRIYIICLSNSTMAFFHYLLRATLRHVRHIAIFALFFFNIE